MSEGTVYTSMNSWKEPFNTYNFSMWIFSLFWLLNWFQACVQSDTIVVSLRLPPYCLCWLCKKGHRVMNGSKTQKFIELWTNQKQTDDSALVQSKGTKTIYFYSIRIIYIYINYTLYKNLGFWLVNSRCILNKFS
jgi:hypothetical protein